MRVLISVVKRELSWVVSKEVEMVEMSVDRKAE
jgi:hypothetical protein